MADPESTVSVPGSGAGEAGGGLRIDDVYLEGPTPDGHAIVGHLSVVMNAGGITVLGPAPGATRNVPWGRMTSFTQGPTATLPDGGPATTFEFVVDGRPLRLLFAAPVTPGTHEAPDSSDAVVPEPHEVNGRLEDSFNGSVVQDSHNGLAAGPVAHDGADGSLVEDGPTGREVESGPLDVVADSPDGTQAESGQEEFVQEHSSGSDPAIRTPQASVDTGRDLSPTFIVPPVVHSEDDDASSAGWAGARSDLGFDEPIAATSDGSEQLEGAEEQGPSAFDDGMAAVPHDDGVRAAMPSEPWGEPEAAMTLVQAPWPPEGEEHGLVVEAQSATVPDAAEPLMSDAEELPVSDAGGLPVPEAEEQAVPEAEEPLAPAVPELFDQSLVVALDENAHESGPEESGSEELSPETWTQEAGSGSWTERPVGHHSWSDSEDVHDAYEEPARMPRTPLAFSRMAALPRPQPWRRAVFVVALISMSAVAAGLWYTRSAGSSPAVTPNRSKDTALASSVGIRPGDLTGWQAQQSLGSNPFAAGAGLSSQAMRTAQQAKAVLARCLRVPVSAVDGAFGLGAPPSPSGQANSPVYVDPSADGGTVGSTVAVMQSARDEQADFRIFQDPNLFATCYQPYAQAMLRYTAAAGSGSPALSFATVEPVTVPSPPIGSPAQVAAFQIARIGTVNGQTVTEVTTAIAIYGGRLQASIGTVSDLVFPIDAQNQLVHAVEARVIGASLL